MSHLATADPPWTTEIKPGGNPASSKAAANRLAVWGVLLEGLSTTALPAAMAGATLCATVLAGALKGCNGTYDPEGNWNGEAQASGLLGRSFERHHLASEAPGLLCGKA